MFAELKEDGDKEKLGNEACVGCHYPSYKGSSVSLFGVERIRFEGLVIEVVEDDDRYIVKHETGSM